MCERFQNITTKKESFKPNLEPRLCLLGCPAGQKVILVPSFQSVTGSHKRCKLGPREVTRIKWGMYLFIYSEILVNIFTYIVTSVYMITLGNLYVTRIRRRHAYNCLLRIMGYVCAPPPPPHTHTHTPPG